MHRLYARDLAEEQTRSLGHERARRGQANRVKQVDEAKQNEVRALWNLVLEKRSASETLLNARFFNDSLSRRSYYSAFHAVTLLFLLHDRTFSSHKQIIGMFNKEFVHTELFSEQVARDLEYLFESRHTGDYDYHVSLDEEEAKEGLEKLSLILEAIRSYTGTKFGITLGADR
ncbi:MAG: HEPN domain-containing protein [Spirochaetaceae bacterium]|nr:MAG: HEPN domain-containing protein [Spirochaetaceae bacterium]